MGDFVDLPTNRNGLHLERQYGEQPRAEVPYEAWVPENGTSAGSVLATPGTLSHLSFGIVSGVACGHGCLLLHRILLHTPKIWCVRKCPPSKKQL
jgi:hypothetical protein